MRKNTIPQIRFWPEHFDSGLPRNSYWSQKGHFYTSKAKCTLAIATQSSHNGGIFSKHQATHWSVKKKNYQKHPFLYTYILHFITETIFAQIENHPKIVIRLHKTSLYHIKALVYSSPITPLEKQKCNLIVFGFQKGLILK